MSFIYIPMQMNLIKAHGGKGSGPFSFERSATSPPQADHVLVDLFFIRGVLGGCVKVPRHICSYQSDRQNRIWTPNIHSLIGQKGSVPISQNRPTLIG